MEDVRSGEALNLKAAKRKRGIPDKPRKKDPRGRKPKAQGGGAAGDRGDPGDAGGGIALGRLVDPEEPSLARPGSDRAVSESNPLFLGDDNSQSGDENASAQAGDLRRRAKLALGNSSVEASTVEEGAPWPAEGGVFWLIAAGDLEGVVDRVVDCVKKVSDSGGVVLAGPVDVRSAWAQRLMALPELTAVSFEGRRDPAGDDLPRMLWGFRVGVGDFRRACGGFGAVLEMAPR